MGNASASACRCACVPTLQALVIATGCGRLCSEAPPRRLRFPRPCAQHTERRVGIMRASLGYIWEIGHISSPGRLRTATILRGSGVFPVSMLAQASRAWGRSIPRHRYVEFAADFSPRPAISAFQWSRSPSWAMPSPSVNRFQPGPAAGLAGVATVDLSHAAGLASRLLEPQQVALRCPLALPLARRHRLRRPLDGSR